MQQCGVGEGETRSTRASGACDSDKTAVRVIEKRATPMCGRDTQERYAEWLSMYYKRTDGASRRQVGLLLKRYSQMRQRRIGGGGAHRLARDYRLKCSEM